MSLINNISNSLSGLFNMEDDKLDLLGFKNQDPSLMTDPAMTIGGNPHVNVPQQQITEQQTPTEEPGVFDKAGDFFGDEERMARITIALNSMRLNPDASIATSMENKIKSIRSRKKGNATAEALIKMGRTDLAELVKSGVMDGKTAYSLAFKPVSALQEKIDLFTADPEKFAAMKAAGVISGGGVNINMGDKTNMEFIKAGIADAKTQIQGGYSADNSLRDLAMLRKLGDNPVLQEVPDIGRGFIPTGFSPAMDAYNGLLNKVAKGLRQAGEGVMTEKDFEVLLETSGAASMNIKARQILQASLEETARRQIERSNIASQFMSQQLTLPEYYTKMRELKNKPMFTPEQSAYLSSLEGTMAYGTLNSNEKEGVSKEQWNKLSMVQKEAFIKARGN